MQELSSRRIALGDTQGIWPAAIDRGHRIRELAREAELLDLDGVALDLFFAVARIEATGRVDAVHAKLADTAAGFAGAEARFYRRAVSFLDDGDGGEGVRPRATSPTCRARRRSPARTG